MERIFYKSDVVDAYNGYPIYVFDTSYLPGTLAINYEYFIPTMMRMLPTHPYEVIMFSGGLNKISWIWGIKFLKTFLADSGENVNNLHKIFAVHESWFVKTVTQIFTNFSGSKSALPSWNFFFDTTKPGSNLLTRCESLSDLSNYVDITRLKLSLNIFKHDAEVTLTTSIPMSFPKESILTLDTDYTQKSPILYYHFYQLFNIVDMYGHKVELVFHRPGNRMNTDILLLCICRNQLIWINDWDLYCIASCFKKILLEVSVPLLPVDAIVLPISDDLEYVQDIFKSALEMGKPTGADVVLFQTMELCKRIVDNEDTKHTYSTILKSLCHSITHEPVSHQNRDRVNVAIRFIKSALVYWDELRPVYEKQYNSVNSIANGTDATQPIMEELYDMFQDIMAESDMHLKDEEDNAGCEMNREKDESEKGNKDNEGESDHPDYADRSVSSTLFDLSASLVSESTGTEAPEETTTTSKDEVSKSGTGSADSLATAVSTMSLSNSTGRSNPSVSLDSNTKANSIRHEKLSDMSNVQLQFPPQKYKFERAPKAGNVSIATDPTIATSPTRKDPLFKKPVVRGRKVGELTRLFEERAHAMDLLRTL